MISYNLCEGHVSRTVVGIIILALLLADNVSALVIRDDATGGDCASIGNWDAASNTCTMTTDLTETIQIDSDNITLNGNGHSIKGDGTGDGIYLTYLKGNITIQNLEISQFVNGIRLSTHPYFTSNNTIIENTISDNQYGIYGYGSAGFTFIENTISNNQYGVYLDYLSRNNTFIGNTIDSNNFSGIGLLYYTTNNKFIRNNVSNNHGKGIGLGHYCGENEFTNNIISSNSGAGIIFGGSGHNEIKGNTINSNNGDGIVIISPDADGNIFIDNVVNSNNGSGINLQYYIWNTTIINNTFNSNNGNGIHLGVSSDSSTINGNYISLNNMSGILLDSSQHNTIYNNFFNNTNNFELVNSFQSYPTVNNTWNTTKTSGTNIIGGLYLGGNFWANPGGAGFSQTCTYADKEGICDSPYILDASNTDYLPLTIPVIESAEVTIIDSYVNSETPDTNYGTSFSLIAGTETLLSSTKIVYLKFDISSIPEDSVISEATANLRLGSCPYCGNPETISAYAVTSNSWDETTITYNNRPVLGATPEDTISVSGTPPYWYSWQVTEALKNQKEQGFVSIALKGEGPGQCDKPFYSRESLYYPPFLSVVLNNGDIVIIPSQESIPTPPPPPVSELSTIVLMSTGLMWSFVTVILTKRN